VTNKKEKQNVNKLNLMLKESKIQIMENLVKDVVADYFSEVFFFIFKT